MKRTIIGASALVLSLPLFFFSCDAMFQTNLFAKATHKEESATAIAQKSPSDLQKLTSSQASLDQFATDTAKRTGTAAAILDTYQNVLTSSSATAYQKADAQVAVIAAADILIKGSTAAAQVSAGALGAVQTLMVKTPDFSTPAMQQKFLVDTISSVVPTDVMDAITNKAPSPPAAFVEIIQSFTLAQSAYAALGGSIVGNDYGGTGVSDSAAMGIAVNALLATVVEAVQPLDAQGALISAPTPTQVAVALWDAILNPTATPAISIDKASIDAATATATATASGGYLANILGAAGFDAAAVGL